MATKKSNQETTYVGIYDAKGVRKNLLMNAKELLILLKDIQLEKLKNKISLEKIGQIKKNIKEIESLGNSIISSLPIKKLDNLVIRSPTQTSTQTKEQEKDKNDNELYRIDLEIQRIEQLLNKI